MSGAGPATSGYQQIERRAVIGAVALCVAYAAMMMTVASTVSFYTLDDPYIHMALAENLARGHFGVNLGELSNPSSSFLWPWLLAAFEKIGLMLWAPLLINIACFAATVRIVLAFCLPRLAGEGKVWPALALVGVSLFAFNVFGVIFTGMEHSLHVLLTAIIVTRAIDRRFDRLMFAAMLLGPLVRFEGVLLVAFGAGAALYDRKWVYAAGVVAQSLALLAAYAIWLQGIGLPALPSSVLSKSTLSAGVVDGGGGLGGLIENLRFNLAAPSGPVFAMFAALMIAGVALLKGRDRVLALGMFAVLALAFVAGKLNGYGRYEVYVLLAAFLAAVHLFAPILRTMLGKPTWTAIMCGLFLICGLRLGPYVAMTSPVAARNIYQQQFQMHGMVTECWRKPVAINDLGWVSFRNDGYVLDLWGLGNEAARKARATGEPGWMERLVEEKGVDLAIVYPDWFDDFPQAWVQVGAIGFKDPAITPYAAMAPVFATRAEALPEIQRCLRQLSDSAPAGVVVEILD